MQVEHILLGHCQPIECLFNQLDRPEAASRVDGKAAVSECWLVNDTDPRALKCGSVSPVYNDELGQCLQAVRDSKWRMSTDMDLVAVHADLVRVVCGQAKGLVGSLDADGDAGNPRRAGCTLDQDR